MSNAHPLYLIDKAKDLIEFLCDSDGFFEGSANELAIAMGWFDRLKDGKPHRKQVNDVCTMTREQDHDPELRSALGGFVIAYRANSGGFVLIDPTGETHIRHWVKILKGDLQKQQMIRTMNRRRAPTWKALGTQLASNGDLEGAQVCWSVEIEIKKHGDVSDESIGNFWHLVRTRNYGDEEQPA